MDNGFCSAKYLGLILAIIASMATLTDAPAAPPTKDDPHSGVTQNWDKALPAGQRFVILEAFNNEAVRDNNTGLVWEKSPAALITTWDIARHLCAMSRVVGNQKGWRLPSFAELSSLLDPTTGPVAMQSGHPFTSIGVSSFIYWTATTDAMNPANAWVVGFATPGVGTIGKTTSNFPVWCVRGPMNADQY